MKLPIQWCVLASVAVLNVAFAPHRFASSSRRFLDLKAASDNNAVPSLIVISPPGGVGEVTAVKAAELGSSVRWFVVSQTENQKLALSKEIIDGIAASSGAIEIAGSQAASLLTDDASSSVSAVSAWCGSADAIICTFDGVEIGVRSKSNFEDAEVVRMWKDAIKVAAKEASRSVRGTKITVLSAMDESEAEEESNGLGNIVGNLLNKGKVQVPFSLTSALDQDDKRVTTIRYGKLFGLPESSPDFSPLVGGPRREPELCEEYANRAVRVDPTLSITGNQMMGSTTRSSRHAVGEIAALMALNKIEFKVGSDVCVSSQRGTDPATVEIWQEEFSRVEKMLASGAGAPLFVADFASVPNVERLADWIATKWAPAVLRTYDLATIRSGERPVLSFRAGEGKVEIIWQELVDFKSVTTGRMIIQVTETGLIATRGPGDASKGFGSVKKTPLAGEDVLVRRLAEAASQAIEKGLAKKAVQKVTVKPQPVVAVTTIQAAGTVVENGASSETGARQDSARRSTERSRGTRRKDAPDVKSE